jgi:WD40 repeat protein
LRETIAAVPVLKRNLGALLVPGGTVNRTVWVQAMGDLVREGGLGILFAGNPSRGSLPDNTGDLDPLENNEGTVNDAVFTRDCSRVVVASADRSVRVRDVASGRDLRRLIGHTASVWSVALSPDDRRLASGSMDNTVRVWDLATGRELHQLRGHRRVVTALAFTEDGERLISGGFDGRVIVWDATTGREVARLEKGIAHVHALAVQPGSSSVLIAADEELIHWDWKTDRSDRWENGHSAAVTSLAFHPDGQAAISGGDDGTIIHWDVGRGGAESRFESESGFVKSLEFNSTSGNVLSGGSDCSVRF